jgi:HD-GYP domain-containing protein (c-di-GMP phosphodiesterase class II)
VGCLVSDRPYRTAWNMQEAIDYIADNAGILFDPGVVQVLLENINHLKQYYDTPGEGTEDTVNTATLNK